MGIQINSQPQSFQSNVVIGNGLSAVNGLTVYGSVTANSSISSPAVSAGYLYGDGSKLTNINAGNIQGIGGVTSVNGLTGALSNVAFTVSANNFTQSLTGTTGVFITSISSASIDGSNILSGGQNLFGLFGSKSSTDSVFTTVSSNSSRWSTAWNQISSGQLSAAGVGFTVQTSLSSPAVSAGTFYGDGSKLTGVATSVNGSTGAVTGVIVASGGTINSGDLTISNNRSLVTDFIKTNGSSTPLRLNANLILNGSLSALSGATFVNTTFATTSSLAISAVMNSGAAFSVSANGTGDIASFYDSDLGVEVLHIGGINSGASSNVGIKTSFPNKTLTVSGEISASGDAWFGSNIYANNVHISSLYAAKGATDAATTVVSSSSSSWNQSYTALTGASGGWSSSTTVVSSNSARWTTAWNQISSGQLSAAGVGFTVQTSLSTPTITGATGTFTTSISSPAVSAAKFYGDGSLLTGVATNIPNSGYWNTAYNQISSGNLSASTGGFTIQTSLSTPNITANTGTFTTSISSPAVSASTFYGDGSKLTGVATSVTGVLYTSGGTITGANGFLNVPLLSAQTISATNYQILSTTLNNQTASTYTLLTTDNGKVVTLSSLSAITVTIPTGLPIGYSCSFVRLGVGLVTFTTASTATTINSVNGYKSISDQYGGASLLCYASESFLLNGSVGYP